MKILFPILMLTLASLACMTTTSTITDTIEKSDTARPNGQPSETAMPDLEEPAAGAVFEIPTPGPLCARVTAIQSLHLRDQPNDQARVQAYLKNGEQVRVIAFGSWWKIDTDKGTGYANAKYLELTECE